MKTVFVNFESGYNPNKEYHYLYDLEEPIAEGDCVVVDTPNNGLTVVKVRRIDEGISLNATKYVVDRVDMNAYRFRQEREKRRKAIVAQLTKMEKELQEEQRFAILAQTNPQASKLLEELRSLK